MIPSIAPRCPNHPEISAVSLCNDCRGSYCEGCLYLFEVNHQGTLHLCPSCSKKRESTATTVAMIVGVVCMLFGLIGIAVSTPEGVVRGVFSLFAGFAAAAWALQRRTETPKGTTLRDKKEALKVAMETWVSKASDFELHQRLLHDAMREHGAETGWQILERKIGSYMKAGMTRSQALRKLAEEKGY